MNLSQLRYFRKLAEIQHFTHAAEELFITQPALSNSIKQLEGELGVPLFEQQGRNVRLTKYGKEFNKYVTEGLDIIDKGIQIAQEHANSLSGTVDIGTIFTVQSDYLPALLRTYRSIYGTHVDVRLYQGLTQSLLDRLIEGTYDIVICAYVEGLSEVEFLPVVAQDFVAVVHQDNPLSKEEYIDLSDLHDVGIVTYRPDTSIGDEVKSLIGHYDLSIQQWCDDEITLGGEVSVNPDLIGISLNTLGLAPFPELKRIPFADKVGCGVHQIYLAYRKNAHKTRAVENMITLAEHLTWDGKQGILDPNYLLNED